MKYSIYILSFWFFFKATTIFAQDQVNDVKAPAAPGFVLLGKEPSAITKPTSIGQFATSLISGVTQNGLNPSFAVETTPYFWRAHNSVTREIYDKNTFSLRYISLSLANGNTHVSEGITGTGTSIGFRIPMMRGSVGDEYIGQIANMNNLAEVNNSFESVIENVSATMKNNRLSTKEICEIFSSKAKNKKSSFKFSDDEEIKKKQLARWDLVFNKLTSSICSLCPADAQCCGNQNECKFDSATIYKLLTKEADNLASYSDEDRAQLHELYDIRKGLMMDLSGAAMFNFPNSRYEYSQFARWGMWYTIGYGFDLKKGTNALSLNLLGVLRYIRNENFTGPKNNGDAGVSLQLEFSKLLISGEVLWRYNADNFKAASTNRYDLMLQYKYSNDVNFKFTFGKNFDQATGRIKDNLLSLFGVQYNLMTIKNSGAAN